MFFFFLFLFRYLLSTITFFSSLNKINLSLLQTQQLLQKVKLLSKLLMNFYSIQYIFFFSLNVFYSMVLMFTIIKYMFCLIIIKHKIFPYVYD